MRRNITLLTVAVLAATQTAASAQPVTVQSLMDNGYTVAGITTSPTGGGKRIPAETQRPCLLFCR